jgi:hypothetical protein
MHQQFQSWCPCFVHRSWSPTHYTHSNDISPQDKVVGCQMKWFSPPSPSITPEILHCLEHEQCCCIETLLNLTLKSVLLSSNCGNVLSILDERFQRSWSLQGRNLWSMSNHVLIVNIEPYTLQLTEILWVNCIFISLYFLDTHIGYGNIDCWNLAVTS